MTLMIALKLWFVVYFITSLFSFLTFDPNVDGRWRMLVWFLAFQIAAAVLTLFLILLLYLVT